MKGVLHMDSAVALLLALACTCTVTAAATQCWPPGNYSLPSSTDGCPSREAHKWVTEFHYSEVATSNMDQTTTARDLHLNLLGGVWGNSIFLSFCTINASDSQMCDTRWPVGQYCIFKTGNGCPASHFTTGSTEWSIASNSAIGGTSAISSTGSTATINFCCSVSGSVTTGISLPNTEPFYLVRYGRNGCQRVEGMTATMEELVWHAPPQPTNNLNTPIHFSAGTYSLTLPLCYYTPKEPASTTVSNPGAVATSVVLSVIIVVIVVVVIVVSIVCWKVLTRRSKEYDVEGPRAQAASPNSTATRTIQSSNPTLFGRLNPNSSDGQRLQDDARIQRPPSYAVPVRPVSYLQPAKCVVHQEGGGDSWTDSFDDVEASFEAGVSYTRCASDSHPPGCGCGQHRYIVKSFDSKEGKGGDGIKEDWDDAPLEEYWSPPGDETKLWESLVSFYVASSAVQLGPLIGRGNFGDVFKATWRGPAGKMEIAVKKIPQVTAPAERIDFLKEAATMGQFQHANVVKLYGVIGRGGHKRESQMAILIELMPHGNLLEYLAKIKTRLFRGGNPDQISDLLLRFAREIASGMRYLSRKKFVHRDLAARNILLDKNFVCKIGDFGMSRDLGDSCYYKSGGGIVPVRWTAPESLAQNKYSSASDVWSYGCVLYELWSLGKKPLSHVKNGEIFRRIIRGYRQPPPPGCPRAVYQLMIDCWHPMTTGRPSFDAIGFILLQPLILMWTESDLVVHPEAPLLGADPAVGEMLYPEVQRAYGYSYM